MVGSFTKTRNPGGRAGLELKPLNSVWGIHLRCTEDTVGDLLVSP